MSRIRISAFRSKSAKVAMAVAVISALALSGAATSASAATESKPAPKVLTATQPLSLTIGSASSGYAATTPTCPAESVPTSSSRGSATLNSRIIGASSFTFLNQVVGTTNATPTSFQVKNTGTVTASIKVGAEVNPICINGDGDFNNFQVQFARKGATKSAPWISVLDLETISAQMGTIPAKYTYTYVVNVRFLSGDAMPSNIIVIHPTLTLTEAGK